MDLLDFRWSALARYHDAALESGVVLLALSRCPVHSHFDVGLRELTDVRADIRMMSELQQFSINARKAVEIADLVAPGLVNFARTVRVHQSGEIVKNYFQGEVSLCDASFWWIISRIIHSVTLMVWGQDEHLGSSRTKIYSQTRSEYVFFSSDRDGATAPPGSYTIKAEKRHCVKIEQLLAIYAGGVTPKIESAIQSLRPPLPPPRKD